ncbi:hypothetical protein K6119_12170 [Paracrocinitomix mangrovi]|uniref:hypothetical protein n=1 Tax=Paracrocinitomix mangrovi TaxID=2862509 RepID=UPI001C8ECD52|nr:hypothetical protein [Paracrocinitomix mangrovi]UKN00487.1 hypothetical protein K6119_12170 [Paracrocinitomix mangrovi]
MKKMILLMVAGISTLAMGQNVTENKVSFNFIQLPSNPISTDYKTFNVLVERKYEQANNDSLVAYQAKVEQATLEYEALLIAWKEQVKNAKKNYLTQMVTWQKAVNGGNTTVVQPKEPIYPSAPIMREIPQPLLHADVLDDQVSNSVSLAGFDRGEGGATITVGILPISNYEIKMSQKGEGAAIKYTYTANYKLPLELKVEDPSSGVVLQTIILNSIRSYTIGTYASQYEYDLYALDNESKIWTDVENSARSTSYSQINTFINDKCGYPVKTRTCEIYTVKKHKDHQYNDLVNAFTVASQGYQMVGQSRDRAAAKGKINEAITIWKTMLKESNMGDNKARVNDKVTALLYTNLAEAYIWLSEFDTAEMYINQAIGAGVFKFKKAAEDLRGLLNERKLRWNTNF